MSVPTLETITAALDTVLDPEIRKPITELNMVGSVDIGDGGAVTVNVLLTTEGCPLKTTITRDVENAVKSVEGVTTAAVNLGVMTKEQREELRTQLRGGQ